MLRTIKFQLALRLEFLLGAAFYAVSHRLGHHTPADTSMALWLDLHPSRPRWW